MIDSLPLGWTPTPLEPLPVPSQRLGVELWVKRDDLTGLGLSGNKVRKLRFLFAQAQEEGASVVITCGGIQSNHCRATAVAACRQGLKVVLLLRGAAPAPAQTDGNLLLARMLGAEIHWVDHAGYRQRDTHMAALAESQRERGETPYIIPEGGSNAVGALGFVEAGRELAAQCGELGLRPDTVICAVGSGGTLAGLALAGLSPRVLGIAVCDDRAHFVGRVQEIGAQARLRFGLDLPDPGERWDVIEGFQGRGYGLSTPRELACQVRLTRETGLFLDPVYTGKAWFALEQLVQGSPDLLGRRIVFWHTGGVFGLFGRGAELVAASATCAGG